MQAQTNPPQAQQNGHIDPMTAAQQQASYWAALQQHPQQVAPPQQSYPQPQPDYARYLPNPQPQPVNPIAQQMQLLLQSNDQIIGYLGTLNEAYNVQIQQQGQWNQYLDGHTKAAKSTADHALTRANVALIGIVAICLVGAITNFLPKTPTNANIQNSTPTKTANPSP